MFLLSRSLLFKASAMSAGSVICRICRPQVSCHHSKREDRIQQPQKATALCRRSVQSRAGRLTLMCRYRRRSTAPYLLLHSVNRLWRSILRAGSVFPKSSESLWGPGCTQVMPQSLNLYHKLA